MNDAPSLVSTDWLADRLGAPDVRIVDASWHLPDAGRDAKAEYAAAHIPGAVFFDIDEICDLQSPYPHMMPSAEKFSSRARDLGLGDGNRIIVYDSVGIFSAPRVWWMFKVMGHKDVAVLDGGLPKWQREGRPVSDMAPRRTARHFTARVDRARLRDVDQVRNELGSGREQLIDARAPERFAGSAPEPRPGVRPGHIPGARNLCYKDVLSADGTLLGETDLRERISRAGLTADKPVVASCGSGISACVLLLALDRLGFRDIALYDGSWAEWGSRADLPLALGQ